MIILDVLPFDDRRIFSFIYPRGGSRTPAEDFSRLSDLLGNVWWEEQRRTRKKYLAARCVLERAENGKTGIASVVPVEVDIPSVNGSSLVHLQLGRVQLQSSQLKQVIKNAYRLQAMRHHPDRGGTADMFRKIREAYEELLEWAETPSFVRRRGFPDKWFYDGERNRWVQPTPVRKDARLKAVKAEG